jgi:hypothetical protein
MKIKLLFLMSLMFLGKIGFSQNTVTYSALTKTIDLNSGVEGTVDILVNCYGSSSTPVFLNTMQSCGDNDGILSQSYTNGSVLTPGQNTTIRLKFAKIVTTDTQIVYKFSTNGSCQQSESQMIKITVNYKASGTPKPNPSDEILIQLQYYEQHTVYVGQYPYINIFGYYSPSYSYEWQKKSVKGVWETIPGEVDSSIRLYDLRVTTLFRRILRNNLGAYLGFSNEIAINVVPALSNNTITISGSEVKGSLPAGGNGSYKYSWNVFVLEGEDPWIFEQNTKDFSVPASVYNFIGTNKAYVSRIVRSGEQISVSDGVLVPVLQEITNNVITLSGSNIIGTVPNGGDGSYKYDYYLYQYDGNGEIIEVYNVGNDQNFSTSNYGNLMTKIYRKVTSGYKISYSNVVEILPVAMKSTLKLNSELDSLVIYPNPTAESVNFATGFSENKVIEIVVYSENIGEKVTVFKGVATPNQVVKWEIPAHYKKGLYYYKIMSGNAEVKSGKIIYQ